MIRLLLLLTSALLLSACAYHASSIPENEWARSSIQLNIGYQQAYRNINQGADTCKFVFVREGNIYTDINQAKINLYLRSMFGGSSGMVLGYVDIKENQNGSLVQINLWNFYERSGVITAKLDNWAKGNFTCD